MADLKGLGPAGEAHAWHLLKARGDRLVARNYACKQGEVDLITWHRDTLVFTEVRARTNLAFGTPAETVTVSKQRKIKRAAQWFLQEKFNGRALPSCRFDVVWVVAREDQISEAGILEGAFY